MLAKLLARSCKPCWPGVERANIHYSKMKSFSHMMIFVRTFASVRQIRPWSKEEDANLRALVQRYGEFNWTLVSNQMPGRDDRSCKARWDQSLCLTLKSAKWTDQEDQQLHSLVEKFGENFRQISEHMDGRTIVQLRMRWFRHLCPRIRRGSWTEEEDEIITSQFSSSLKRGKWVEAARLLPHRSLFEIHQRARRLKHEQQKQPVAERRRWSAEEDAQLQSVGREFGYRNWGQIAARMPGRTMKQCNSRWLYLVGKDPGLAQDWSTKEDDQLAALVEALGTQKWPAIAARLGKTPNECKLRWERNVHPMLNTSTPWTSAEDRLLLQQHALGRNWLAIAHDLPGRSHDAVKTRYAEVLRQKAAAAPYPWSLQEEAALEDSVRRYQEKLRQSLPMNWSAIRLAVPGRTNRECFRQWASMASRLWKHKDAKRARTILAYEGVSEEERWSCVARKYPRLRIAHCKSLWLRWAQREKLEPTLWTTEQTGALLSAVGSADPARLQPGDWQEIANSVPGKTAEQCAERCTFFHTSIYQRVQPAENASGPHE